MMKKPIAVDVRDPAHYRSPADHFDRRSVKEAVNLLMRAKRPAILAGYGVHLSRAYTELLRLAEQLRMPVATTPKAKGVFPEDHLLSLGVFGFAGSPQSDAMLLSEDVDLVLAIGTSFGESSSHAWDPRFIQGKKLMHIDVDPREIGKNYPVEVGLVGDAKQVLLEMSYQVLRDTSWKEETPELGHRLVSVRAAKAMYPRVVEKKLMTDDSVPIRPQRLIHELRKAIPSNGILFVDIGNVMAWALHYYTVTEPGTFFLNMGFGSMGHGVAAAIGGKIVAKDRPVVALVGDGSFAMNGMEVHTAVENNIPVIWVVMNNGGHGMVHLGEKLQFKDKFCTSMFRRPLEIAKMASAMGADGVRVEKPGDLSGALHRALFLDRPCVIEVMIDPNALPPLGARLATLEKFFQSDR
jgi:acetolactate synthase-1/2/3 large subunit